MQIKQVGASKVKNDDRISLNSYERHGKSADEMLHPTETEDSQNLVKNQADVSLLM